MALTPSEQFNHLIGQSQQILIVFSPGTALDAIASSLALKRWLEKKNKRADVAAAGFVLPKNARFLPGSSDIKPLLQELQKFIIKIDVSNAPLETLSYDVSGNTLSIYLTPKSGLLSKNELRTAQSTFKYDLIITLNTPDLAALGTVFSANPDLFYRTPLVNIDYHATNEHYGQVNLVDITATSVAETLTHVLKQIDEAACDTGVATALLTGMVAATHSFKNANVTPQALQLASNLIKQGAERETVIHHLYHAHSLTTLKLWGHALTHLQNDGETGLVWASLTRDDFVRSGASEQDLYGIIEELINNSPEAKVTALFYESTLPNSNTIHCLVSSGKHANASELLKSFNPTGDKKQASIVLTEKTLKEAETIVLSVIKNNLNNKLGST